MVIGICDDEQLIRDNIKGICTKFAGDNNKAYEILEFNDGDEVLRAEKYIDLLFLDIELKNCSGIELMNKLLKNNKVWRIVFVSSHDEMIMDVFGVKTLAFVKKPFGYNEISKWLEVVYNELDSDFIVDLEEIKDRRLLKASEILYIESKGNYSEVALEDEKLLTRRTMSKWEDILKKGDFLRIHKSFIVNMDYISQVNNDVILKNEEILTIGRSYKKSVIIDYNNYVLNKMRNRR